MRRLSRVSCNFFCQASHLSSHGRGCACTHWQAHSFSRFGAIMRPATKLILRSLTIPTPGHKRDVQTQHRPRQKRQDYRIPPGWRVQVTKEKRRIKFSRYLYSVHAHLYMITLSTHTVYQTKVGHVRCMMSRKPVKCLPSLEVQINKTKSTMHPHTPIVSKPANIIRNSRWFSSPTAFVNQRQ